MCTHIVVIVAVVDIVVFDQPFAFVRFFSYISALCDFTCGVVDAKESCLLGHMLYRLIWSVIINSAQMFLVLKREREEHTRCLTVKGPQLETV